MGWGVIKTLLSMIYFILWRIWDFLYETKWIVPKRVNAIIVSVGNLTVGGTGKTPLTIFLARFYQLKGYRVGIVSRGYKGNYKGMAALVSDGKTILTSATVSGDEPALIAQQLLSIGAPIAVSKKRDAGCQLLIEQFGVNLILLDDGFQHRRLHRDLNLLLIDTTEKNKAILPKGPMRETPCAAKRADLIILTRQDADSDQSRSSPFGVPVLHAGFFPVALIHLQTGVATVPTVLSGETILAFCAIGNPNAFIKTLADLGAKIAASVFFRDHFSYSASDMNAIEKKASALGVKWIVTTQKDAVKIASLSSLSSLPVKLFVLQIDVLFQESEEEWEPHFLSKIKMGESDGKV